MAFSSNINTPTGLSTGADSVIFNVHNGQDHTEKRIFQVPLRQIAFVLAVFVLSIAALTRESPRDRISPEDLKSTVAQREIRAMFYFESTDIKKTQEARDLEAMKVPVHYRIHNEAAEEQIRLLQYRLEMIREQCSLVPEKLHAALQRSEPAQTPESVLQREVTAYATRLKEETAWESFPEPDLLALWLTPDKVNLTSAPGADLSAPRDPTALQPEFTFEQSNKMGAMALSSLRFVLFTGIRHSVSSNIDLARHIVILRDRNLPELPITTDTSFGEVPDLAKAATLLNQRLTESAKTLASEMGMPEAWARIHDASQALVEPLLIATLQEDRQSTENARAVAMESVAPVLKEIEAGEIIQDAGKRWTEQSRIDAQSYMHVLSDEQHPYKKILNTLTAHFILVLLVFWALYKRLHFQVDQRGLSSRTVFNLSLLILCGTLIIGRISSYFEPSGYVLPVAAGGILFAILAGPQRAAFFGVLLAAMISAQYQYNWRLLLVQGAMIIAGAFSIYKVRKRNDMTAAALIATFVGLLCAGAGLLASDLLFGEIFMRRSFLILLNGGLCVLVVPALLPWLERLFDITTDMQLLEYSDLNNELLRKLAIAAPASYAHSLLLGQIAEAAADAIGANGLQARVCAYYHDIGKRHKPEHFTENQGGRKNIHDNMPPEISARMIRQHVIEGAREAREHNLPKPVIDGILEHHGTCRISFFYDLAQKTNPGEIIADDEFRYPGPKPQCPETAILMICDASESGARSILNPTQEKVRQFVDTIIKARAEDNQFDNCDLTLKQLRIIRDVVARSIFNAMHTRIAYPGQNAHKKEEPQPLQDNTSQKNSQEASVPT
ncbi:MAG TPA: HDIG domain-containing protein [Candidatus Hydrogenedentes bacterium]|jgi:putative nucleotidyltransferase with HDIG domain|nr:HDIG domain-containing protein [Candidatus Hydrogenedentota bacterium]HOM46920.1 HDIG domain-containing protein [Candidatus Hydrogenedentota bacterium]HOR49480.1 HDIG domain-containing protein [Candidatus Hydrogenedentota bacterium]HPX85439.1 HDIG domain-containing protein [Candidatus Hydrogenedentota bacterium]HQB03327.1 HDIG domain-containing protein [Candidatus Hydrogenedentota bacterium]